MRITILLVTLLLGATLSAPCQQIFRMRMDVVESTPVFSDCFSDIDVTWGTNGDTIAFAYNLKIVKFWKVKLSPSQKAQVDELNKSKSGDYAFVTNYWGEAWLLRGVMSQTGLIIFLNDIHNSKRFLLFDYTETEICSK